MLKANDSFSNNVGWTIHCERACILSSSALPQTEDVLVLLHMINLVELIVKCCCKSSVCIMKMFLTFGSIDENVWIVKVFNQLSSKTQLRPKSGLLCLFYLFFFFF